MKKENIIDVIMLSKYGKKDGGRETWLYNFLPELLKNDSISRIHLFGYRLDSQEDNTPLLESLDPLGRKRVIPIILEGRPKKYPMFISMYRRLKKFTRKTDLPMPDHTIAVGGMLEGLMVSNIRRFKKSQKVVWLRSIFTQEKAYRIPAFGLSLMRGIEKRILRKADIVIVNGDDTKAFYQRYNLKIHTIKNAINPNRWSMPAMVTSEVMEVAFIGRLSEVKGIDPYLELAKRIKASEHKNNFIFHVVGDANTYWERVKKLDGQNVIRYHGPMNNEDIPTFLENIHICVALTFVSPKLGGAGLSNALLEQMAAEKIILAWSNNAFNQILDETCAYSVEQYNVDELEKALLQIYADPLDAFARAQKAKEVIAPYTIEAHVEKFIETLDDASLLAGMSKTVFE